MNTYAPDYYTEFKCIADKCTHSCCVGWEINNINNLETKRFRRFVFYNYTLQIKKTASNVKNIPLKLSSNNGIINIINVEKHPLFFQYIY